jgi:hypothetical protein
MDLQGALCRNGSLDIKVRRFFVCISSKFERNEGFWGLKLVFIWSGEFESPWVERPNAGEMEI